MVAWVCLNQLSLFRILYSTAIWVSSMKLPVLTILFVDTFPDFQIVSTLWRQLSMVAKYQSKIGRQNLSMNNQNIGVACNITTEKINSTDIKNISDSTANGSIKIDEIMSIKLCQQITPANSYR